MELPTLEGVRLAVQNLDGVALESPLQKNLRLSEKCQAEVFLKREDLQQVRSFKIRGAYNTICRLSKEERQKGIVCSSAGNHAQGVAFSCRALQIKGTIFMPVPTPQQKVDQVVMFGGDYIDIVMVGDTYDDSEAAAQAFSEQEGKIIIHPFNDIRVIEGQATIAMELIKQASAPIDYIFIPIGGGGLISGIVTVFSQLAPKTQIIGVEPFGAPSMREALAAGKPVALTQIDKFVDGAAVKRVGNIPFEVSKNDISEVVTVPEGLVCQVILDLYNKDGIVAEPAAALSVAALENYGEKLKGKTAIALLCGGNNDITRTPEIKERALLFAKKKHYFIVRFPQRAGALKEFVNEILGPNDDITYFEFNKKTSKVKAPAVVGIELKDAADFEPLLERMKSRNFYGEYLNEQPDLFEFLI
ncbi:MAG: threonine ammonia-lyase IlvA [Bacteroidetes bacterium]|nr:threonine ammonia-lyase IlvA [Bacteroidota bacterium]MDA0938410.1 threonine ammonia-lyase IlvA [Bacteroidota bacterium]